MKKPLLLGEFRIRPASACNSIETVQARHDDEIVQTYLTPGKDVRIDLHTGRLITQVGDAQYRHKAGTNYFALCFSSRWECLLIGEFPHTDACLVIHQADEFCERIDYAAAAELTNFAGLDGPVFYGGSSPLGAAFSKPIQFIVQNEWRFSPRPPVKHSELTPISISIGNI